MFSSLSQKLGHANEEKQHVGKGAAHCSSNSTSQFPSANYDRLSNMSSSFMAEETAVDATSEKDVGNEYFKQKKFKEAIDCYSRSIALSPTAVAYANRAMAYLKIKRYQEAEDDCTEALNLDDRYIKAYSRRATARKGLGKLRDSLEDVEFALKLEPQNEELKKQRAEVKSLLEKAILAKASGTVRKPAQVVKEVENNVDDRGQEKGVQSVDRHKKAGADVLPDNAQRDNKTSKNELGTSVQELATRAASRAMAEAARNITTPNTAYQFELLWKGFSGDRSLQARLLKVTPPDTLPQIFRNALTAPLLVDIFKCLASLFMKEMELAVQYLENLTKVPRFDMIIMCLPSADKADICRTWEEVFLSETTPIEIAESLSELHPRYCG